MTDSTPSSISVELVLTGPADQILAAKAAILRIPNDCPGIKFDGRISTDGSNVLYYGDMTNLGMTVEELLGYDEYGSPPPGESYAERARSSLRRAHIENVGQLVEKTEDDLLHITNFGQKSLDLIVEKLAEHGLSLKPIG